MNDEIHRENFKELVAYTRKESLEDRPEAQFGCMLIDTEGNKFLAVTSYDGCEDMTDRALKYGSCVYSVKNAGNKWIGSGREHELVTAYCVPCFPCGVDQAFLKAFGVKHLVVPKAHPTIRSSWKNFSVTDLMTTFVNKNMKMTLTYFDEEIHGDGD